MSQRNKVIFYHLYLPTSLNMIVIFFLQKLLDKKIKKVIIDNKSPTDEENISVRYGCASFFDSYLFSLSSLE